ncbi:MAG: phosphoribosylglycinamide synthetase C domain-containing protein, partial [bacterium]
GYPFVQVNGPRLPVEILEDLDCDVWWNEVAADSKGQLYTTGHRIADVVALGSTLDEVIKRAYENIRKIRCLGSYYRTDIGQSLWPPGSE